MCLCKESLAYVTKQYKIRYTGQRAVMLCGRERNRRSGVALAMRQTLVVYPPTGSTAMEREMSTPPIHSILEYGPLYLFYLFGIAIFLD